MIPDTQWLIDAALWYVGALSAFAGTLGIFAIFCPEEW